MPLKLLVEGRPGSGKTTVLARLADLLAVEGIGTSGFVTHELREAGTRVGFEVETLDGRRVTLAHVDFSGPPRVGKYGVDIEAFERVALPALDQPPAGTVVLVDELGKMELASAAFRERVTRIFDSPLDVVAAVHVFRHPFTEALKRRHAVERVRVTHATRDELPRQLAGRLATRR